MEMYEYFEKLFNDVINTETSNNYMPKTWDITAESYGWKVEDTETGETLYIELEV